MFISDLIASIQVSQPQHYHTVGLHAHKIKWISPHHLWRDLHAYFKDETPLQPRGSTFIELFELSKTIGLNPITRLNFIHTLIRKHIHLVGGMKCRPDLIHVHVSFPSLPVGYELSKQFGIPFILTEHSSRFPDPRFESYGYDRETLNKYFLRSSANIAVSADLAKKFGFYDIQDMQVIPNLVSWAPPEIRIPGPPFSFILISHYLDPRKRIDLLIDAVHLLRSSGKEFIVRMVGEGPMRNLYIEKVKAAGIADVIQWYGHVSDGHKQELLSASHCLVVCSDYETFGVTVIEANAFGIPVLATRCGGVEEIISSVNGRLVDKGNSIRLAEGMEWMMRNYSYFDRKRIQQDCYLRFSATRIAEKYLNVYDEILLKNKLS
ncbi:MAG TPA: glycosyltransferase family 4 protein [Saprospiraceae bacterium]|nr:glycosyltransferase family 4 protein [Saprospiraceae bacterium]HNT19467.1 glycosyltransferase family 4 protein [Saprospiraceae bacterium]